MRSMSRNPYRPTPVMNVTPLVDVVLVLLIIFMVVIPAMEKTNVELPSIFNVDPEGKSKTDPYTLSLTADGKMFFEQEPLADEEFEAKLRAANDLDPSRRLLLRADRKAKYGRVRALFKTCQEIAFPGVSLRVNELKGPGK